MWLIGTCVPNTYADVDAIHSTEKKSLEYIKCEETSSYENTDNLQ
jgi:hypothetical protein